MLWEKSFCWKSPIALAYTRGHFSSLVSMEMVKEDLIGAGANVDNTDEESVAYLPVVDFEGKLLPLPFLKQSEVMYSHARLVVSQSLKKYSKFNIM